MQKNWVCGFFLNLFMYFKKNQNNKPKKPKQASTSIGEGKDERNHCGHVISIRNSIWQQEKKEEYWESRLKVDQTEVVPLEGAKKFNKQDQGGLQQNEKRQWLQITAAGIPTGQKEKVAMWAIKHRHGLSKEGVENRCGVSYPCG